MDLLRWQEVGLRDGARSRTDLRIPVDITAVFGTEPARLADAPTSATEVCFHGIGRLPTLSTVPLVDPVATSNTTPRYAGTGSPDSWSCRGSHASDAWLSATPRPKTDSSSPPASITGSPISECPGAPKMVHATVYTKTPPTTFAPAAEIADLLESLPLEPFRQPNGPPGKISSTTSCADVKDWISRAYESSTQKDTSTQTYLSCFYPRGWEFKIIPSTSSHTNVTPMKKSSTAILAPSPGGGAMLSGSPYRSISGTTASLASSPGGGAMLAGSPYRSIPGSTDKSSKRGALLEVPGQDSSNSEASTSDEHPSN